MALNTDARPSRITGVSELLDVNTLRLIEHDLGDEDTLSIVFLILDNYLLYENFLNVYFQCHNIHSERKICMLEYYAKRIINFQEKLIEALCITRNTHVITKMGLNFDSYTLLYVPELSRIGVHVNAGAKIMYRLFESLGDDCREQLFSAIYNCIPVDDRLKKLNIRMLEIHTLYWISVEFITITPDGGDFRNLLKCLKSMGHYDKPYYCDIEWYSDKKQSTHITKDSNNRNDSDNNLEQYTIKNGLCLIINEVNFVEFGSEYENRDGSEKDVDNLKSTFDGLNFDIHCFKDLTATEILSKIREFGSLINNDYDCFTVIILSHGIPGHIVSVDHKEINIEICERLMFTKKMENIPKFLIIQACQGDVIGLRQNTDDLTTDGPNINPHLPSYGEFLRFDSTINYHVSYRHKKEGSWFITDLCSVLQENRQFPISIDDWKKLVMKRLKSRKAVLPTAVDNKFLLKSIKLPARMQIPNVDDRLTKKYYFLPFGHRRWKHQNTTNA